MPCLTRQQQRVLDLIVRDIDAKGYPPSVRELGASLGLASSATVHSHLKALEDKGYIRRHPKRPRAIEVLPTKGNTGPTPRHTRVVPLVGRIAAGQPLLAQENIEDNLIVPDFLAGPNSFVLRVRGSSMVDAGILDGDYLVVQQASTAGDGDIVVALVDDETTVKRFFRAGDRVRLQPENRRMAPIFVRDVTILGRVTAVLRRL